MTKRLLVDATHPEETRVALVDGNWLSDFDFERASKLQLKGNIYLAKVIRVEPSLQAAFVEYGGNRHGFLPFSEIHPDYFRIPMADRPPDEIEAEDDAEDGIEDEGVEEVVQAYAAEAEELAAAEEADDHQHEHTEIPAGYAAETAGLPNALDAEPQSSSQIETMPGFAEHHDVGLITDFGNADMPMDQTPIETVGGEAVEVEAEQRYRRPKKPNYKIQEVVKRRQVMLIQVVKEERGNKGAALTTFLSLAGRYCVLMPNTDSGGGVSRKITSHQDRRRMKEMLDQLEIPEGMAVILRTAGMEQEPAEIQRDLEYLLRLWNNIREETLQSTAPALIYEEASLIKRTLRDLYSRDLDEILVCGERGYQTAIDFMKTIMPDQLDKIKLYTESVPLFIRFNVEKQIDQLYNVTVQLRSGGYIVINPTEALVSIDVNSGRATRERHIESTALKTNLEAAEEIGRQLRLRDLAGLIVIDFIDMEDGRNNAAVERRIKESMRADRARLQIGRISPFGLLELSRQRLHPSLMEVNFEKCPHCAGVGLIRSVDSAAISILRVIEEEGLKSGGGDVKVHVPPKIALYILNQKRSALSEIERRYGMQILLHSDEELVQPDYKIERASANGEIRVRGPAVNNDQVFADTNIAMGRAPHRGSEIEEVSDAPEGRADRHRSSESGRDGAGERGGRKRGRYGRNRGERGDPREGRSEQQQREGREGRETREGRERPGEGQRAAQGQRPSRERPYPVQDNAGLPPVQAEGTGDMADMENNGNVATGGAPQEPGAGSQDQQRRGRRRGRRGGRNRRPPGEQPREGSEQNAPPREATAEGAGDRPFRQRESRGERQGNWNNGNRSTGNAPVAVPVSIHDIDTTPRQNYTPPQPASAGQASAPKPYQVVSEGADDKPKGGWWRRLTGQ